MLKSNLTYSNQISHAFNKLSKQSELSKIKTREASK